jgi:hypothetical protein
MTAMVSCTHLHCPLLFWSPHHRTLYWKCRIT